MRGENNGVVLVACKYRRFYLKKIVVHESYTTKAYKKPLIRERSRNTSRKNIFRCRLDPYGDCCSKKAVCIANRVSVD